MELGGGYYDPPPRVSWVMGQKTRKTFRCVVILLLRWYNRENTEIEVKIMILKEKRRIQISLTEEQIKKLSEEASKRGLTKSNLLAVIFEEWLEKREEKAK